MAARKKDLEPQPEEPKSTEPVKSDHALFMTLVDLVQDADRDSDKLPALHRFYIENPGICDRFSLMGSIIRDNAINAITSKTGSKQSLHQDHQALMNRLGIEEADPLERVVIERIGMDWLRLMFTDSQLAYCGNESVTWIQFEHMEKAHERAHRRFIKSCESLAKLRALREMTGRRPATVLPMKLIEGRQGKDRT